MKKIAIIGGGISGLSAGCYAAMNGYEAQIFEMHDRPGGLCTSWTRNGYTFEGSIHWLEGSSPKQSYHKIWRELGALKGKTIYYHDISFNVCLDGTVVRFPNDPDALISHLSRIAPGDIESIRELAEAVRLFYPYHYMTLSKPKELFTVIDKLKETRDFIPMMRLFQRYRKTTIEDFARRFKHPMLQQAMRNIVDASSIESDSINGVFGIFFLLATKGCGIPEGGSLGVARSIENRFLGLGGIMQYGAKVKTILTENGAAVGVELETGGTVNADYVISAADGHTTIFSMLDGRYINKKIRTRYEKEPIFPSHVQVSIGADLDVSGIIDPHVIFNIYQLKQPILVGGKENRTIRVKNYSFSPAFAPPGKSALVIPFASDSEYWEGFQTDRGRYTSEKKRIAGTVLSCLEDIVPGIGRNIEVVDVATPLTYIRYTNTWRGSSMGFAQASFLNMPRTLPGLTNFYMAGQWVGDTGVSGAAKSGRDIAQLICTRDEKEFVTAEA